MPKDVGQYLYREDKNSIKNNLDINNFNDLNVNLFGLKNLSFQKKIEVFMNLSSPVALSGRVFSFACCISSRI